MNPAQAETCEPSLLKETAQAAKELGVGIHIHAGGNLREFNRILYHYRKPVVEYLADAGILGPKTVLGHLVVVAGHSLVDYPKGKEIESVAESGTSVGHCAHKYAKMAQVLESFDRYVESGINVGLGTDTYPFRYHLGNALRLSLFENRGSEVQWCESCCGFQCGYGMGGEGPGEG